MEDNISLRLTCIEGQLVVLTEQIDKLTEAIIKLNKTCEKMDSHINFVEDTYTTLRAPLDYFATKVNSLTGNSGKELPYIE